MSRPPQRDHADPLYPKYLTADQAARMLQVSRSTIYHWVSSGRLRRSVLSRGKPLRLDRDRLLDEFAGR